MSTAQGVRLFQRRAEGQMVDACVITRAGAGTPVFDPATGLFTTPAGSTVYTGRCEVQRPGLTSQGQDAGERQISIDTVIVKVPVSVTGVAVKDVVTVTASRLDPALVGRRFIVADDFAQTYPTARRLRCAEVTS